MSHYVEMIWFLIKLSTIVSVYMFYWYFYKLYGKLRIFHMYLVMVTINIGNIAIADITIKYSNHSYVSSPDAYSFSSHYHSF